MGRIEKLPQQGLTRTSTISPQNLQDFYEILRYNNSVANIVLNLKHGHAIQEKKHTLW